MQVDLILLSRDLAAPRPDVWQGIQSQRGVQPRMHRVAGPPRPGDTNRWETIARARNEMRTVGTAQLVMFLDDDVVLGPDCVARLAHALERRPEFAALAADSAGEMNRPWQHWDYPDHVGLAAVLFRRERLATLTFRWEQEKCECLCCCDDLRAAGWGIGYLQGAQAWHRPLSRSPSTGSGPGADESQSQKSSPEPGTIQRRGRILAAFDRRDQTRFRTQFLTTLRESGNDEPVWAFAYGLFPTELDLLAAQPGVTVVALPEHGVSPGLRRLGDFQDLIARWPADTPVAYWDAGDVLFQGRLGPLWDLAAANPGVLMVAEEPLSFPDNPVIRFWTECIHDPAAQARAFEMMSTHVFLNGGFAAGTASALLDYCREGDRLLHSPALLGVGDWGDQVALNLYCHSHPERWKAIHVGWNYTLAGRDGAEHTISPAGRVVRRDGQPVHVLHGNAGSLHWLDISPWGPADRRGSNPTVAART
ncbi:MAG: glycosyltransferase family 2 protein [Isosphaeraceae bacterium]